METGELDRWRELERFLIPTGGTGLFRIHIREGNKSSSYQFLVLRWNVVAATRDGEYQPRFVAEEVLRGYFNGKGTMEWVPLPPYYPPLHLFFFISLNDETLRGKGGQDERS